MTIAEVVIKTTFFPSFVSEEYNKGLPEEISKAELQMVVHSFQKDKSPRPDGWPI